MNEKVPGQPNETKKPASGTQKGRTQVDAYIAQFDGEAKARLEAIRSAIQKEVPEATEKISYGMPTFVLEGNLVHYAAFKRHIGLYPLPSGISSFEQEIASYTQGKGSVQFQLDEPLPLDLILRIVHFRVTENRELAATRKLAKMKSKREV